ncbi:MAG TPA: lasso peptide biosynthesis B2 protein [Propionibacteriaceae bacterium]|nr:lasso peptide biosynthesis B2 protein [Propionibacteriaceae bacterium]
MDVRALLDIRAVLGTVEAAAALGVASLLRRALPMRRWSRMLGTVGAAPAVLPGRPPATRRDRRVAVDLRRAERRLPWTLNCLDRAVAGQLLLRRRGGAGTVVIGLDRLDPAGVPHAWLVTSDSVIVGGEVAGRFVAATAFSPDLRRQLGLGADRSTSRRPDNTAERAANRRSSTR